MVREWLIFFSDGHGAPWRPWSVFTRPGYRHVSAAAFDAEADRFVFYDPQLVATQIEVLAPGEEADIKLGTLALLSTTALRVRPGRARRMAPPVFGCVGAMKALLGIGGRALVPWGLYRQLLRDGAEIVEIPRGRQSADARPDHPAPAAA